MSNPFDKYPPTPAPETSATGYYYHNHDSDFQDLNYLKDPGIKCGTAHVKFVSFGGEIASDAIMVVVHGAVADWEDRVKKNTGVWFLFVSRSPSNESAEKVVCYENAIYSDVPSVEIKEELFYALITTANGGSNNVYNKLRLLFKRNYPLTDGIINILSTIYLSSANDEIKKIVVEQLGAKFNVGQWKEKTIKEIDDRRQANPDQEAKCWLMKLSGIISSGKIVEAEIGNIIDAGFINLAKVFL